MNLYHDFKNSRFFKELAETRARADLTIWDEAIRLHECINKGRAGMPTFQECYDWYLNYGFVIKTPRLLVMAHHNKDTWFIYLAISNDSLLDLFTYLPYRLQYVSWGRAYGENQIKFVKLKTDRLYEMLGGK